MQGGEAISAIGALDYSKDERKRLAKLWVISYLDQKEYAHCVQGRRAGFVLRVEFRIKSFSRQRSRASLRP